MMIIIVRVSPFSQGQGNLSIRIDGHKRG